MTTTDPATTPTHTGLNHDWPGTAFDEENNNRFQPDAPLVAYCGRCRKMYAADDHYVQLYAERMRADGDNQQKIEQVTRILARKAARWHEQDITLTGATRDFRGRLEVQYTVADQPPDDVDEAPGHGIGIPEPAAVPAGPKKSSWQLWIWLVLIVVCCGTAIVKALPSNKDQDSSAARGVESELICKDFVKKRLKSPSTAKFSGMDHRGFDKEWTVTGSVDSQNSFGAMIRNSFTCKVQLNADGDTWHLVSLTGLSN